MYRFRVMLRRLSRAIASCGFHLMEAGDADPRGEPQRLPLRLME
jgi:hypothetical protein